MSNVKRYYISARTFELLNRADPSSEIPAGVIGIVLASDFDALQRWCNAQADVILSASHSLGLPVDAGADSVCEAITDLQRKCAERHEAISRLEAERNALRAKVERLRKDSTRYRWLREQQWDRSEICAVMHPKLAVKLGYDCPSLDRLDAAIDGAMEAGQ